MLGALLGIVLSLVALGMLGVLAAKQGLAASQTNLGICYHLGRGTKKDLDEAEKWLVAAAQQGQEQATKELESLRAERSAQPSKKP